MLFGTSNNLQAVDIPYNWNADYNNGENVTEYDLDNNKRNFYAIDTSKVSRFGLFGQNKKYYFEMTDGSFILDRKRLDIEYHLKDGRIIGLTSNFEKKDLITYKEAYTDLNIRKQGVQKSNLKSINFGYKTKIFNKDFNKSSEKDNSLELFFQPVISLDLSGRHFMELKMSSNIEIDGDIVFKLKGQEFERFNVLIEENKTFQISWSNMEVFK